jgi:hypothetical protein
MTIRGHPFLASASPDEPTVNVGPGWLLCLVRSVLTGLTRRRFFVPAFEFRFAFLRLGLGSREDRHLEPESR